ncbi:MAG TPA: 5'-3' exonuclease [Dermatophilaceae bacterium]|nr:5'-3' exonuclease [Dermatophilaceae bacterium]
MTQRLMLLDSASLYFRAFYGVPDQRRSPDEPQTNAVRGFLEMISTLVSTHRPTHLVACWDNDWRPAFRVNAIPTYKTHRLTEGSTVQEESPEDLTPQVPLIADALKALGIARIGSDGYEADDVIGTLTRRARGQQLVDVVTGDRDLFQLVDDDAGVRVLYTARGGVRDPDVVTQSFLQSKYLVPTGQAYADMATLRGDASDGLPGVAGIGEKTAATLINRYGDLAGLRRALAAGDPQIKGAQRTRLEAASAYLDVASMVVQVALDAPVPDFDASLPRQVGDSTLLSSLASSYGLTNPINRVLSALGVGKI